jgi:hypothetical protein
MWKDGHAAAPTASATADKRSDHRLIRGHDDQSNSMADAR